MRVLGAMMISSFIIFPALTARRVAASFKGMILASALSAFISFTAGMGLSILSQLGAHPLPVGACVVLCSLVLMLLSMALPQRTRKRQ